MASKIQYPYSRGEGLVEEFHGVKVPDPYRWLEDDRSPETEAWVAAQNKLTFETLGQIPARDKIRATGRRPCP